MRNEKGYILLTTIILTMFTLFIAAHLATVLVSERSFLENTKHLYIIENLRILAVDSALKNIKAGMTEQKRTFYTDNGIFEYTIESSLGENNELINSTAHISCETNEKIRKTFSFQYSHTEKKIVDWLE
ncbi:competence type IV pilus minor pilin ComGG [Metabacillus fastidiosus]|uniref:competence type IV pilus minor pilin ComGG n=1 Tax=Metabacillus fastidiosus TaxID=1458 RepID=UPI002E21E3C8|nr:competence type IV pilus minor pilin ComGG [Metabacillus fastidiosus]